MSTSPASRPDQDVDPPLAVGVAMRGELLFFNQQSAHGFIRTEDGERLYVAGASFVLGHVPEGRCAGTVVEFTRGACPGDHAFQALGVSRVAESLSGRARLRSTRKVTR